MTNILENILVMVVLAVIIYVPIFFVKRNSGKKKQVLLQHKLQKIISDNNFKLSRTDKIGNLLIACSDNRNLILLNLIDFSFEIINCEKLINAKEEITYNGKEVKTIKFLLSFNNASNREIAIFEQYVNSERELSLTKKLATSWSLFLNATN